MEPTTRSTGRRRTVKAVLFDLGGTLLKFNPGGLSWLEWEQVGLQSAHACLTSLGYQLPKERFISWALDALPKRWQRATEGRENLCLGDLLREACLACGVVPAARDLEEAVAAYIAPLDADVVPFPDTRPALDILRAMGLKIGLISNTMWPGEFHRRELERFDLLPYFDCVVFSSDVGLWKPRPEVYHLALDALGVAANDALFVGDIPEHDIVGAQRAGIRAVYRRNESFSLDAIRPDATVSLLTELSELIKGWE